ncbi:MAG: DUF3105 domain-containing protein [Actinomycetia bacterium]|nr:DUF3105 domain-containing protein [Actinomycetes bacterium]
MAKQRRPGTKPVDAEKRAAKRVRRDERKIAEADAKRRRTRQRRIKTGLMVAAGVVLAGAAGFVIFQRAVPPELPGVAQQTNEGRTHATAGRTAVYATATPTSGTHSPNSARCGIFDSQVPAEFAVHSLEHGTVAIWYRSDLDGNTVSGLREIVGSFDDRVILSPNAQMDDPIVATAWNRLKAYDTADPEIATFIETYRNRGPESLRCAY